MQIGVISDFLSLQVDELRKGKSQVDNTHHFSFYAWWSISPSVLYI